MYYIYIRIIFSAYSITWKSPEIYFWSLLQCNGRNTIQRNLAQYLHFEHILTTVRLILIFLLSAIREIAIEEKSSNICSKRSWRGHFLWLSSCMSFILHHKARLPELSSSPYQLQQSSPYVFLRFSENKAPRRRNCYTWGVLDIIAASTYRVIKAMLEKKI